jgi:hypothetical protein
MSYEETRISDSIPRCGHVSGQTRRGSLAAEYRLSPSMPVLPQSLLVPRVGAGGLLILLSVGNEATDAAIWPVGRSQTVTIE